LEQVVTGLRRGAEEGTTRSLESYRQYLYLEGDERRESVGSDGRLVRGALTAAAVAEVLKAKGRLPVAEYLRCRARYFCDGAVFGGREWVEGIFGAYRERFGSKRKTGARAVRGLAGGALFTVRELRLRVFGASATAP
jgi:hypothetical protein